MVNCDLESVEVFRKIVNEAIKRSKDSGVSFSETRERIFEALDVMEKTIITELFNVYGEKNNGG